MNSKPRTHRGIALVELLCASSLAVLVLGATMVTFSGVHRSFLASLHQVNAQADQNRVFAYLRRDLRGASAVQIAAQGTQITMSIPAQNVSTMNFNLGSSLLSLLSPPQNAPASTTIRYYRQGTSIIREIGGVTTELSASATQFQASLQGATVRIGTSFQPRFSLGPKASVAAATEATTCVHLLNASQL
jgi:Tfp pilus assembly protein PilW